MTAALDQVMGGRQGPPEPPGVLGELAAVLCVWSNPLVIRSARARLRPRHLLSWGVLALCITAFVFMISYVTATQQLVWGDAVAARTALVPTIIVQGIILMALGTGAVAGGIARERTDRLLDYQRLTPMTPAAKIVGLLIGLPIREYFLFALTLPFVGYAAVVGEISLWKLGGFYLVFLTSVWVYHMTGLVAGMVVARPIWAGLASLGMVAVLYLVLPQLSNIGLTFFEFLTVRPTFYGMVLEEVRDLSGTQEWNQPFLLARYQRWREVAFFGFQFHPVVFTLALQSGVLATLFSVMRRKWRQEANHPLSKLGAVVVFAGVQFFLVGSLWPVLMRGAELERLAHTMGVSYGDAAAYQVVAALLLIVLAVSGAAGLVLINLITPNRHTVVAGYRRSAKAGRWALPPGSDAASSLPATLAMIVFMAASFATLYHLAQRVGALAPVEPPGFAAALAGPAYVAALLLFVQGLRAALGGRWTAVGLFLLWVLPIFVAAVYGAWTSRATDALYIALPSPALGGVFTTFVPWHAEARDQGHISWLVPHEAGGHMWRYLALSLVGYGVASLAVAGAAVSRRLRLARQTAIA